MENNDENGSSFVWHEVFGVTEDEYLINCASEVPDVAENSNHEYWQY